jgi:hypothetical protein
MDTFDIGERVTYYPQKQNEQDNRHWPATVKGQTPSRRWRVEIEMPEGVKKRAVSAKRLTRQSELDV